MSRLLLPRQRSRGPEDFEASVPRETRTKAEYKQQQTPNSIGGTAEDSKTGPEKIAYADYKTTEHACKIAKATYQASLENAESCYKNEIADEMRRYYASHSDKLYPAHHAELAHLASKVETLEYR